MANIGWIIEKARELKKKKKSSTSVSLTRLKPLTVWNTTNSGKLLKRCEYQTTLPTSWETCLRVKKQEFESYMKQLTGPKLRKEYNEAIYCNCLFNLYAEYIMRNAGLNELQSGIKIAQRNINSLRHADDITLMAETKEELKSFLMKVKGSEKAGLKLNIQKNKIMASGPITSWQIEGEN